MHRLLRLNTYRGSSIPQRLQLPSLLSGESSKNLLFSFTPPTKPAEGSGCSHRSVTPFLRGEPVLAGGVGSACPGSVALGTGSAAARCTSTGNRTLRSPTCACCLLEPEPNPFAKCVPPAHAISATTAWQAKLHHPLTQLSLCPSLQVCIALSDIK